MLEYPLNIYKKALDLERGGIEYLHYGLVNYPDEPPENAQQRATDYLLENLPSPPRELLEVGLGLGTTLYELDKRGYLVTGISPDAAQIELVQRGYILGSGSVYDVVKQSRFEDFKPNRQFEIIVFQESAQYIDPDVLFHKCRELLVMGGSVVIMDEVPTNNIDYLRKIIYPNFTVQKEEDLTKQAMPSITYLRRIIEDNAKVIAVELEISINVILALLTDLRLREKEYKSGGYKYMFVSLKRCF